MAEPQWRYLEGYSLVHPPDVVPAPPGEIDWDSDPVTPDNPDMPGEFQRRAPLTCPRAY